MIQPANSATWVVVLPFGAMLLAGLGAGSAQGQDPGEAVFQRLCTPCHSTGTDRVLGPGLAGVTDHRDHDWLIRKITDPARLRAEGDSITQRLVEEYDMAMVGLGVTREEAELVLAYLAEMDATAPASPAEEPDPGTFTEEQVQLGTALFQGSRRLENRAVSCNACHDVARQGVLGGGSLAVSLTDAYGRLGPGALEAMIRNPPFPVMRRAYEGRPVSDEEARALLAFFHELDAAPDPGPTSPYGVLLAGVGALGSALLAGLFTLAWRGRRRGSINREMFERQVRTR